MGNLRLSTVFIGVAVIVGAIAGGVATMYLLGGVLDAKLFDGAHHLLNLVISMLTFVMVIATFLTLAERKWSALMQNRIGPNRARLPIPGLKNSDMAGIPHIVTDVLKLLTKED